MNRSLVMKYALRRLCQRYLSHICYCPTAVKQRKHALTRQSGLHSFSSCTSSRNFSSANEDTTPKLWTQLLGEGGVNADGLTELLRRRLNVALFAKRSHEQGDLMPYVVAQELVRWYSVASKQDKANLFVLLAVHMGVDKSDVLKKMEILKDAVMNEDNLIARHEAKLINSLTAPYQHLFDDISKLQNGVEFLVNMRKDFLNLRRAKAFKLTPELLAFDKCLKRHLAQWFANGFLELEQITWNSPGRLLEKVMSYEAVHPLAGWDDLKFRTGLNRRVFTFSHRLVPGEPLVILHTLLSNEIPNNIQAVIDSSNSSAMEDKEQITTATFYSISSTQRGLDGIGLGNLLIKRVVDILRADLHNLSTYVTLSPVPGFRKWLDLQLVKAAEEGDIPRLLQKLTVDGINDDRQSCARLRELLADNSWQTNKNALEILQKPMMQLCARYLAREKRRGFAVNPVAHFHLRNGASLWRINWMGNKNDLGMAASYGLMVNYRYDLDCIETNNHDYVMNGGVAVSDQVEELL